MDYVSKKHPASQPSTHQAYTYSVPLARMLLVYRILVL